MWPCSSQNSIFRASEPHLDQRGHVWDLTKAGWRFVVCRVGCAWGMIVSLEYFFSMLVECSLFTKPSVGVLATASSRGAVEEQVLISALCDQR